MIVSTAKAVSAVKSNWAAILAGALAIWNHYSPVLVNLIVNHPHISLWSVLGGILAAFYVQPAPVPVAPAPVAPAAPAPKV